MIKQATLGKFYGGVKQDWIKSDTLKHTHCTLTGKCEGRVVSICVIIDKYESFRSEKE